MVRSGLKTEADYLPVAARIAWFRKDHPYWSIITEVEQLADKAIVMNCGLHAHPDAHQDHWCNRPDR